MRAERPKKGDLGWNLTLGVNTHAFMKRDRGLGFYKELRREEGRGGVLSVIQQLALPPSQHTSVPRFLPNAKGNSLGDLPFIH